ncbi:MULTISPECIES: glycosyltransferase family 4 protein [Sphingobium]|jgi:glycosyltransferase involved in cell wall biosynthesis|uniref:Glycosyl transferase family 1 n=2 Tax=Sphingobium fuliginis (strain ATCC 27551) TaxID=336203 RepID=A0A4Q4IUF0_SPHSA|nr:MULTISPECIES: glycosyltransferase family 4 protein [Sphingobium]QOT73513.1 glycosyltransferase family 4 protein [Sphingobium fuliginis]RYL97158.1 glycosyltransferase [Sphingobium fuliginis]UXC92839.1 glycosyltransferase family 4 protein [Sphingobium sp. RSMS]WDA35566.1 glycosyltransferase family 4 protein [Sphingobium sp. YC-XJ3]GFZ96897.1 glycosyl transferase family 1 [Sphingobium fuliginis]
MKILMLAPQPFYEERGTPIAVRMAAEALAAQGHEVALLSFHEGRDVPMPGVRHHRIAAPPGVRNVPIGFSLGKLVCDLWMLFAAVGLLRRYRPDVIHAVEEAAFFALPLSRLFGTRLVYDADSILSEQIVEKWPRARAIAWIVERCEQFAFRRSDLVIAVCPAIQQSASRSAAADRIHLLPDVAMEGPATAAPVEDLRPNAKDRPLALYVGNLESYQGVHLLIQAMAALAPAERPALVVIGGKADHVAQHRQLALQCGLEGDVRLLGPRPLDGLGRYLAQADILCSPRLKGRNTPMKIFSYMASGKALLATNIESHSQVLDARCAMLTPATAQDLAQGLRRLCADDALRARLGEAAAARARLDYGHAAFVDRLRRAYAVLSPDAGTPPPPTALEAA